MSALARIRKTALQHEQERQYDKALALYARLLDGAEAGEEEVDVALFNRAGDLALRVGDTPRALGYFERALDLYATGGLLNNAVALGVKILRHAPTHLSAHYTLGVLYGRKGFATEARHHLLTYAVQMQRAGRTDEAARVLGEVAAACLDAGERRAALDAYGALGGDLAHAAALAAEPAPAQPEPGTSPVPEAPVMWGAVDFEPVVPVEPATLDALPDPVAWGDVVGAPELEPPAEPAPGSLVDAWEALDFELAVVHEPEIGADTPDAADASPLVFLDLDAVADAELEPLDVAAVGGTATEFATSEARWPDALTDEPPPLRLAELLRLDVEPDDMVAPVTLTIAPVATHAELPAAPSSSGWLLGYEVDAEDADEEAIEVVPPVGFAFDAPDLDLPDPSLADAFDLALELPMIGDAVTSIAAVEPLVPAEVALTADMVAQTADAPDVLDGAPATADDLLDLGAWLRETEQVPTTRLTTPVVPQTGDEQADFDATLRAFTAGVARSVEHHDFDSHYDLGVAFREMGLLDEAIVEFQRAARAPGRPLRALEALAQCWVDLGQPEVALSTLERAVAEATAAGAGDASLVGVHYLMAAAAQALGRPDDARRWFVRVVATDVRFRDAAARLAALPPPSPSR